MWPLSHRKPWNPRIIHVGKGLQDGGVQAVMISTLPAARRCDGADPLPAHLFSWKFSLPSSQTPAFLLDFTARKHSIETAKGIKAE